MDTVIDVGVEHFGKKVTVATARVYENDEFSFIVTATAIRDPGDRWSPTIGEAVALARLFDRVARRYGRSATGMVKNADLQLQARSPRSQKIIQIPRGAPEFAE